MQLPVNPDDAHDVDTELGVDELDPEDGGESGGARRRGLYLLPNLFTTGGLFAGFYAIVAAMAGHFQAAALAVFVAMLMDGLDGRIARLTHTESAFGKEYDSLSDMVSFGLAPALVMYEWAFRDMLAFGPLWGKIGWLGAFFYAICAAFRLARFNVRTGVVDKRYFQGLPSPAAAAIVAGAVWLGADFNVSGSAVLIPAYVLTVAAGALMVSSIGYYSFKDLNLHGRVPFTVIVLVALLLIVVALSPPKVLFLCFFGYVCSGPLMALVRLYRRHRRKRAD
ncbi:MAG TPA: CDP-diacylglycerol--serine O-phosphatidyltransferase [Gammaproteobacteria bacterium]|nr:CDP-diacylglycerol--serine O-phosphatidyltransferase [Gammaproteobacteria bacterium]